MKRREPGKRAMEFDVHAGDAKGVDALYGLEPVFDPGAAADGGDAAGELQFRSLACPYCGEEFETALDTSSGSARYVEDCQVCCQPIEFDLEVDPDGVIQRFSALRGD